MAALRGLSADLGIPPSELSPIRLLSPVALHRPVALLAAGIALALHRPRVAHPCAHARHRCCSALGLIMRHPDELAHVHLALVLLLFLLRGELLAQVLEGLFGAVAVEDLLVGL